MKHYFRSIAAALLIVPTVASATTFKGRWKSLTNETSGDLRIVIDTSFTSVSGSINFNGPFLGNDDPAAVHFEGDFDFDGEAHFNVTGTDFGNVSGHFDVDGTFVLRCRNVNHGDITDIKVFGEFDFDNKTFAATYKFFDGNDIIEKGVLNAHVPDEPEIDLLIKNIDGTKAFVVVDVSSNVRITRFTADATGSATAVVVVDENPYKIKVTGLQSDTKLIITAKNADGLSESLTINVHAGNASRVMGALLGVE